MKDSVSDKEKRDWEREPGEAQSAPEDEFANDDGYSNDHAGDYADDHADGYSNDHADDYDDDFADDYDDDYADDDDYDGEKPANPMAVAAISLALIVAAAIICALLWSFTHRDKNADDAGMQETIAESSAGEETGENNGEAPMDGAESTGLNEGQDTAPDGDKDTGEISGDASGEVTGEEEIPAPETVPDTTPAAGNTETDGQADTGNAAEEQEPVSGDSSMTFTEVSDTVTSKDVTNLRTVPSTADTDNVVGQLANGETLARTGVNHDTGWSRLDYNGQTVYAVTRFLTTDLTYKTPDTVQGNHNRVSTQDGRVIIFTDCSDDVTPKEYVNLRVEPSTSEGDTTIKCQISNGTVVHRTGYSPDSGWSRVEYNGDILYVVTSLVNTVAAE